ncbi:MAG: hypothetical protein PWR20_287 [Bacteroidales bacterium]|jgi:hypothetical protein|nr:hypothetical protein [Anaerophaga sp.]MDK2908720.1 hypothetical protein [Bacteroidales bacterium]MDN5328351.1 hypothetical protein [Bacteroidales bacterium]
MKKFTGFLLLSILILAFQACKEEQSKKRSSGGTLEILVATDNQEQWNGKVGDTIRSLFGQYLPGLPMPEEAFSLIQLDSYKLYNDPLYQPHHAILIVNINPKLEKPAMQVEKDFWAEPQLIIKVSSPTDTGLFRLITRYYPAMFKMYRDIEKKRIVNLFSTNPAKKIQDKIASKFGFEMLVPGGFNIAREEKDFLWVRQTIRRKKQDIDLGFMIYRRPYKNTYQLKPENILSLRDTLLKRFVPGMFEGTYMATSFDVIQPESKEIADFPANNYTVQIKGLWKVIGDFMGGPFISYTFPTPDSKELITIEGYLYNPNNDQKKYMLQLEAMIYTTKFKQ